MLITIDNKYDIFLEKISYLEHDEHDNKLYIHLTNNFKEIIKCKSQDNLFELINTIKASMLSAGLRFVEVNGFIISVSAINSIESDYRTNRAYIKFDGFKFIFKFDDRDGLMHFIDMIRSTG